MTDGSLPTAGRGRPGGAQGQRASGPWENGFHTNIPHRDFGGNLCGPKAKEGRSTLRPSRI